MTWVRLDDGFADHPKIEAAGALAGWLHVAALCYCARHLTDGRIPKSKARRLTDIPSPAKHIAALLDAHLWHEDGDDYIIHDYLDYQPARSEVEKDREAARERMANARRNKRRSSGEQHPNVPPNDDRSSRNGRSGNPVPSRPDPSRERSNDARGSHVPPPALALVPTNSTSPPATDTHNRYSTDFEAWWTLYPRKVAKAEAAKAWKRARALATWDQLTTGLRAATEAWRGRDPEYIPYPAKWLNGRCWDDDHTTPATTRESKARTSIRAGLDRRRGLA